MSVKTGILLINLGTPDSPTPSALRRYLAEFLSDRRVVEIPRILWLAILYGFILPFRPGNSAKLYQKIWQPEGSPLRFITARQCAALQQQLNPHFPQGVCVAYGMRYGHPAIADALATLQKQGVQELVLLPLYPQYSAATTASAFDAITATLQQWRVIPSLRFIAHYETHPHYITAIANSLKNAWQQQTRGDRLLFSFHGLPQRCVDAGDPYATQCHATAEAVAQQLQLSKDEWQVVFQSRFGPAKWLQPYCVDTLEALPPSGVRSVDVVCPGFSADCLETLEEISIQYREKFLAAGGTHFRYISALNDSAEHIQALVEIIRSSYTLLD